MYASRVLRSAAAEKGFIVPPRTSMDILASAANAVVSLFGSEDKRKTFASSVSSGVIVPEVLGQAHLGYFRILALHDELESPTLKEYNFNVDEFLEGVKPALEQFHEVEAHLQNSLHTIATAESDGEEEDEAHKDEEEFGALATIANFVEEKTVRRLLKYSWSKEAEKDPESYAARLKAMVTPEFFEVLEMGAKRGYFLNPDVLLEDGCVQIHNVALLSARGMVVQSDESLEDMSTEEAEQKVTDAEDDGNSEKLPVAAQIEVLYDVEQSFYSVAEKDKGKEEAVDEEGSTAEDVIKEVSMATDNKAEDVKAEDKTSQDSEKKNEAEVFTRTSLIVGVFEGWLNGDPEGNNELRWRVAGVRPASEFPLLNTIY